MFELIQVVVQLQNLLKKATLSKSKQSSDIDNKAMISGSLSGSPQKKQSFSGSTTSAAPSLSSAVVHNKGISARASSLIFVCCNIILCSVVVLNAYYETPLFILGINFIYEYQQREPWEFLHIVQNLFSLLCNPLGVTVVLILYYILSTRKLQLLVHLSYFFMANYVISLLKQSFQQSRPIWVNQRILKWQWFCPTDFGNPSGHSFAVVMLYQPLISDCVGYGHHRFWTLSLFVICIMVPISRMYLGVHSANQIFFGLVLGMIFLILYKYVYQRYLYVLYWNLLMKHHKLRKLAIAIVAHILSLCIPIVFHYINMDRQVPPEDLANLNKTCGINVTGLQLKSHMLTACVSFSFFYGIFYGFLLLMDTPGYRKYLLGLWQLQTCKHMVAKVIISAVCGFMPSFIFNQIAHSRLVTSVVVKYIILSIGTMFFGLGLSYFAPVMAERCKIITFVPGNIRNYQDRFEQMQKI